MCECGAGARPSVSVFCWKGARARSPNVISSSRELADLEEKQQEPAASGLEVPASSVAQLVTRPGGARHVGAICQCGS